MAVLIVVVAVVVVLALCTVLAYNGLVRRRNRTQEAWSEIDVELKRRHDLIPNLVETVKGYAAHERDTFEAVTAARAGAVAAGATGDPGKIAPAENMLSGALRSLFAVAENYPQLRAVETFLQLQEQLTATEDKLEYARRYYNTSARDFNIALQSFPRNLIAGAFGFTSVAFFDVDETDRAVPEVSFERPAAQPPAAPPQPEAPDMYEQIARNKRRAVVYMVLFFAVWVGIGALIGWVAASVSQPAPGSSPATAADVATGAVVAGILAVLGIAFSLRSGARLVLAVSGAHPADPLQYAQLHHLVEALAVGDGLPKPDVYVIDDPSPNAFATGTSPDHAAITATTGLLELMNREELEGVIGHEMSHIKNYDVRLLLVVSTLIGMAGLLASLVWRSALFVRPRRGRGGDQTVLVVLAAGALLAAVAVVFGPLIRLALSRRREELADVSGVELTRNPAGLISALRKLERNDQPFAKFNHATAAMCIDDPLQHHESWFHQLFDTHPPISERIAVLEEISQGHHV